MITITLNKIKANNPCESGWKKVLAAKEHLGMDAPFPVSDILKTNDLEDTLWALRCLPEHDNLWRLYAVWCARQVEHLMEDERSRDALDVAERFARGDASSEELAAAGAAAWDAARAVWETGAARDAAGAAWDAARAVWETGAARDAAGAAGAAWAAAGVARAAWAAAGVARAAQEKKLAAILDAGRWIHETEEKLK